MTLCKAIETERMDLVVGFALSMKDSGMDNEDVQRVFEKPWKWETEFAEWFEKYAN